jgi:hypothetical protein
MSRRHKNSIYKKNEKPPNFVSAFTFNQFRLKLMIDRIKIRGQRVREREERERERDKKKRD